MNVYIPAIGEDKGIFFAPQIWMSNNTESELIITGAIDNEIEQSVYISMTLLNRQKLEMPRYIHVHFPNYNYYKCGISASLGVYFNMLYSIENRVINNRYLMTGELDIEGNVYDVGQIEEKCKVFRENNFDFFFVPKGSDLKITDKIIAVSNIYELQEEIERLEK